MKPSKNNWHPGLEEPSSQRKENSIEWTWLSLSLLLVRDLPVCNRFRQESEKKRKWKLKAFSSLTGMGYKQLEFSLAKEARTWRIKRKRKFRDVKLRVWAAFFPQNICLFAHCAGRKVENKQKELGRDCKAKPF